MGSEMCIRDRFGRSGENAHVTKFSNRNLPHYKTSDFNGLPAVSFNNSDGEVLAYDLAENGEDWTGTNFTQIIVFEQDISSSNRPIFSNGDDTGGQHYEISTDDDEVFQLKVGDGGEAAFAERESSAELYAVTADSAGFTTFVGNQQNLSLIHISEPTRPY